MIYDEIELDKKSADFLHSPNKISQYRRRIVMTIGRYAYCLYLRLLYRFLHHHHKLSAHNLSRIYGVIKIILRLLY